MKVAAIQFAPILGDKEGNLRKVARLVAKAAQKGAGVVVLPELCTTGYTFMSAEQAEPHAEVICPESRTLTVMSKLAAHYNMVIAWGMMEKDRGTGGLYNAQVMTTPHDGYLSYRKANLWGNDYLWAKPGRACPGVLRTSFGRNPNEAPGILDKFVSTRLGLLICRDVRDKAKNIDGFYEKGDADVVLMSANWGKGGFPAVQWVDFARENATCLVVSNRWGVEGHNDFGFGGSCVIHPDGAVNTDGLVMGQDCVVTGDVA